MNARSTRYEIWVGFDDGRAEEMIQCNSRRADAIKRGAHIVADRAGWPHTVCCNILDRRLGLVIFCQYRKRESI